MIAVFAFKFIHDHYKPLNDNFIRLAKLSVLSAKKFYKTKIYCDEDSFQFFTKNEIFFDEVIIIKEFINDYPNHYSIAKIYAMLMETQAYILMDFDVVLLKKINLEKKQIIYAHPEINLNQEYLDLNAITYTYSSYVKPFIDYIKKYFNSEELSIMNWSIYPCFCIVIVRNPEIMSSIFKQIFKLIDKSDINKITPTLLEQFLSHQYIIKQNIDFGFLNEINPDDNGVFFDKLKLLANKYVHLDINKPLINDKLNCLEEVFIK